MRAPVVSRPARYPISSECDPARGSKLSEAAEIATVPTVESVAIGILLLEQEVTLMGMPQGFPSRSIRKWAIVMILSSIPGPLAATEQGDWSRVSGTWRGDVSQEGYPTYSMTLKIEEPGASGQCGTVEFPQFQCISELRSCAVDDSVYNMTVHVVRGQDKCTNSRFELRTRGTNNLEWRGFTLDGRPIATARLGRLDDQAVSALLSAEARQQERDPGYGEWVQDQQRGAQCAVHSWKTGEYISSRWRGTCENGGAQGEGTLELYRIPRSFGTPRTQLAVRLDVRREFGTRFEGGILEVDVPRRFLKFRQTGCGTISDPQLAGRLQVGIGQNVNHVFVDVVRPYVVGLHEIAFDIFRKGAEFAKNNCATRSNQERITINTSFPGDGRSSRMYPASINLSDLDRGELTWRNQSFEPPYGFPERADRQAEEERKRQAAAAERQRQADERQRAEQAAKNQSRQLYDNFNRQHAVQNWPDRSVLQSNPFMFDGQTIGLMASFEMMIDREKAIFNTGRGPIVVSRMPRDWQIAPNNTLMLAANVTGNEILDLGGMRQPVPTLDFVGVRACSERNCNEAFRW